jgi:thiazole synthase ThiGH ThiG subunit
VAVGLRERAECLPAADGGGVGERDQAAAQLVDDGDVRLVRQAGAGDVAHADQRTEVEHGAQLTVGPDAVADRLGRPGQPLGERSAAGESGRRAGQPPARASASASSSPA